MRERWRRSSALEVECADVTLADVGVMAKPQPVRRDGGPLVGSKHELGAAAHDVICVLEWEGVIIFLNVLQELVLCVLHLKVHALAWFGKCLVNGADIVVDLWLLVPKHCEELIHMMFIELHFIAPEAMVLQLAKVLDTARRATNDVVAGLMFEVLCMSV